MMRDISLLQQDRHVLAHDFVDQIIKALFVRIDLVEILAKQEVELIFFHTSLFGIFRLDERGNSLQTIRR